MNLYICKTHFHIPCMSEYSNTQSMVKGSPLELVEKDKYSGIAYKHKNKDHVI